MIAHLVLVTVALAVIGNMKLFGRTGGYYMFWSGFLYFAVGMYCIFVNDFVPVWLAQVAWITVLCLPFAIPPFGRWLNMNITWDKDMLRWFGKKDKEPSNVVPFPEPKAVPPMPYIEPPAEPAPPVTTYYRLGITNNSRVSLQMGYSEITMNAEGINNMIKQLEVFRDQIMEYEDNGEEE